MKRTEALMGLLLVLLAVGPAAAADQWLHIRVEEHGSGGERVSVNLPLNVVESMIPHISVDEFDRGKLRLDDDDLDGLDLQEILLALRDSPDGQFVKVQSEDETVHVAKENDYLVIRAEERSYRSTKSVHIRVPMAVVEALASDEPGELDLAAALRVLKDFEGEELVTVESDDESIRIWIDSTMDGS